MTDQNKKSLLITLITLICVTGFIYWIYNQFRLSTDDAYVNANVVQIAPRVTGQVAHLYVKNNQFVKTGQVLFDLDPALYQIAVDQAKAKLTISLAQQQFSQNTATRMLALVKKSNASIQEGDQVQNNLQAAIAQVALDQANLTRAELNLQYTVITAPSDGWVTNATLGVGAVVTQDQPLFALISNNEFWLDANFKETDLKNISVGQSVNVAVDMYPGHKFAGVVDSISGGTGTAFSLLPPENATGNWVKVTQRVPVRIRVINTDSAFPLRIGTSANVTIRINPWKTHS